MSKNQESEIIVCRLVQYAKINGRLLKEQPTVLRETCKITPEYKERMNSMTSVHGKEYIEDHEATIKFIEEQEEDANRRKAKKLAEKADAHSVLVAALTGQVTQPSASIEKISNEQKEIERLKKELEELKKSEKKSVEYTESSDSEEPEKPKTTSRSRSK